MTDSIPAAVTDAPAEKKVRKAKDPNKQRTILKLVGSSPMEVVRIVSETVGTGARTYARITNITKDGENKTQEHKIGARSQHASYEEAVQAGQSVAKAFESKGWKPATRSAGFSPKESAFDLSSIPAPGAAPAPAPAAAEAKSGPTPVKSRR